MKIISSETVVVGAPWRELTFVRLQTDTGLEGVGEVRMVNKTQTLVACIEELAARYVVARTPSDLSRLAWNVQVAEYGVPGEVTQSALAAFDMACWDLLAQELGVPVWALLGGRFRDGVPAYANGWYQGDRDPDVVAALATGVVDRGYRGLKIDPFGSASAQLSRPERRRSVEILEAVRAAVGPDIEIYVEMHGRFTAATALQVARDIEHVEPGWIEEPVPPHDLRGYEQVRRGTHLRIATGERLHTATDVIPFLERGLVDVLQVDLSHFGGITGVQRLVGWSDAYNVLIAPHNVCGPVGTAAALHLAVACPNFAVLEHFNDFADPWVLELADGAPQVGTSGQFAVPTAPGLGLTLRPEVCAEHPATGGRLALFSEGWERRTTAPAPA
jgi:galactonate dehydratase